MEFEVWKAILAGLVGTGAMTAVMVMGSMMGMKMDMPMTLGTMFLPKGNAAWALGLMVHLMMGAAFFIIYAALFNAFDIESGIASWAALFGVVHGSIAGMAFGMMPVLHPRMARSTSGGQTPGETVPAPGFMGMKMGLMGPMAILLVHALYGFVGGLIYTA